MALIPGQNPMSWISIVKHTFGLHNPGGGFMLAVKTGDCFEMTLHRRQIDVERAVGLRDDLKCGMCHTPKNGMAGLNLDIKHGCYASL